ncbi:unnamed protein product [Lymnaea stagnalis]|uniref:Uncharacterized protein n=1 Tax=Lymnaea stagnalis TaxID=6523 RepID=A0AAV2IJ72_LYMST
MFAQAHPAHCAALLLHLAVLVAPGLAKGGEWGEWGPLSPCSVTCGIGSMVKQRVWIHGPDENIIDENPWTSSQSYTCTDETFSICPEDGQWTAWDSWSGCTKACGEGKRERQRFCQGPNYGGKPCDGENFDKESCNKEPCPPLPKKFDLTQCKENTNFTCTSGKMCIPINQRCDSVVQCHDGSDEIGCNSIKSLWGNGVYYDLSRGRNRGLSVMLSDAGVVLGSLLTVILALIFH